MQVLRLVMGFLGLALVGLLGGEAAAEDLRVRVLVPEGEKASAFLRQTSCGPTIAPTECPMTPRIVQRENERWNPDHAQALKSRWDLAGSIRPSPSQQPEEHDRVGVTEDLTADADSAHIVFTQWLDQRRPRIRELAISSNRRYVVVADRNGIVELYQLPMLKLIRELGVIDPKVCALAISDDGRAWASESLTTGIVIVTNDGLHERRHQRINSQSVSSRLRCRGLQFSRESHYISTHSIGMVNQIAGDDVYNSATGALEFTVRDVAKIYGNHTSWLTPRHISLSPTGDLILVGSDDNILLYDLKRQKVIRSRQFTDLFWNTSHGWAVNWPMETMVGIVHHGSSEAVAVYRWSQDQASAMEIPLLEGVHLDSSTSVALSNDAKYLLIAGGTVAVYELSTGHLLQIIYRMPPMDCGTGYKPHVLFSHSGSKMALFGTMDEKAFLEWEIDKHGWFREIPTSIQSHLYDMHIDAGHEKLYLTSKDLGRHYEVDIFSQAPSPILVNGQAPGREWSLARAEPQSPFMGVMAAFSHDQRTEVTRHEKHGAMVWRDGKLLAQLWLGSPHGWMVRMGDVVQRNEEYGTQRSASTEHEEREPKLSVVTAKESAPIPPPCPALEPKLEFTWSAGPDSSVVNGRESIHVAKAKIRNAELGGRAYWVRVDAASLPTGVVLIPPPIPGRLDAGEQIEVSIALMSRSDFSTSFHEHDGEIRLRLQHACGSGPSLSVQYRSWFRIQVAFLALTAVAFLFGVRVVLRRRNRRTG
jgi:WD40 repeat protein